MRVARALVAAVACGGGAPASAFDVAGVEFVASELFPYAYEFGVNGSATLSELSACRFVPGGGGVGAADLRPVTFADDAGYLVEAFVEVRGDSVDARFVSRVALEGSVDSEGLAYDGDGRLYVSTESEAGADLDVGEFDRATGSRVASPFALPEGAASRAGRNAGYEGLTVAGSAALGASGDASYVATTTEYALDGDDDYFRSLVAWRLPATGARAPPEIDLAFAASATPGADPKPLGVVELEALPRSLLVLERDYTRGAGNLVRLFEAEPDPDGPGTLAKRLVLEWDAEGARGRDGTRLPGAPPVDNYEGLCLLPEDVEERPDAHRRVLLVNDDNANPTQIGTQLVLLKLTLAAASGAVGAPPAQSAGLRVFLVIVTFGTVGLALLFLAKMVQVRRRAHAPPVLGDPGLMLTSLHFTPPESSYAPVLSKDGDESPSAPSAGMV